MDPLVSSWMVVGVGVVVGALGGVLFERMRGTAAKRAAKFEADLVQARSELMHYQEETKRHFGKSAELLGRMATDYREFLDHFVTGAQELCGPNLQELNASGLDRPLLDGANGAGEHAAVPATPRATAMRMPDAAATSPIPPAAMTMSPLASEPLAEDVAQ